MPLRPQDVLDDPEEAIKPTQEMEQSLISRNLQRMHINVANIEHKGNSCHIVLRDKFLPIAKLQDLHSALKTAIRHHEMHYVGGLDLTVDNGRLAIVLHLPDQHI